MNMDEEVWNHAVFSKNRERLLNEEIAEVFFQRVLEQAQPYLSDEHFTVDGTLLEAWAGQKSFRRKDGKGGPGGQREANFHGEKRRNDTHQSTTDPEARLYRKAKGSEAKLSYLGHVLMENRNGLLVQTMVTEANGTAERDAAMLMGERLPGVKRLTLGADKNYDTKEFVRELRRMNCGGKSRTVLHTFHTRRRPSQPCRFGPQLWDAPAVQFRAPSLSRALPRAFSRRVIWDD